MTSLRPRCPPCSHCGDGPPSSIPSPTFPRPTLGEVVRIRWEEEISDDQSDPCEHRPGASKHLPGCGVSGAAEHWDQRRPGPQQEPTGHLPWPSPGRAWGQSRPPPPSAPASEAPGDSWDVRSKQTDKQAHSPTSSPVRGWPPRDAAFSPSPVPGQGPGSQHKRWQWYPPSFLLPHRVSLSSGSLARAGPPLRPPQTALRPLAWHPVQPWHLPP